MQTGIIHGCSAAYYTAILILWCPG